MKFANTYIDPDGIEVVAAILPLDLVPLFDPDNPPPHAYIVPDNVEQGWQRAIDGTFAPYAPAWLNQISVTRRQFKLALLSVGLLDDIETAIAASGDRALQITYVEAQSFDRNNPFVAAMATALGKTSAEIDALFATAATL